MILQDKFEPYSALVLPNNFKYPRHYIEISKNTQQINYSAEYTFPWWFELDELGWPEIRDPYDNLIALLTAGLGYEDFLKTIYYK